MTKSLISTKSTPNNRNRRFTPKTGTREAVKIKNEFEQDLDYNSNPLEDATLGLIEMRHDVKLVKKRSSKGGKRKSGEQTREDFPLHASPSKRQKHSEETLEQVSEKSKTINVESEV